MASVSPFAIQLRGQQRRALKQRARTDMDSDCQVVRARIILMAADGRTNNEIAARLNTRP